jgi:regulatory protein
MGGRGEKPSARSRALGLLARREHSRRELGSKLASRGYEPDEIDAAVADLAGREFQSDARFAQSLARRRAEAGYGPLRIRAELASHGLSRGEIETLLSALDIDWRERARQAAGRLAPRKGEDSRAHAARVARHLAQRGFAAEHARGILDSD